MRLLTVKELKERTHNIYGKYLMKKSKKIFLEYVKLFEKGKITPYQLLNLAKRLSIAKWSTKHMKKYFEKNGCFMSGKCGLCFFDDYFEDEQINPLKHACFTCSLLHFCCVGNKYLKDMLSEIREIKMTYIVLEQLKARRKQNG